MEIIVQGKSSDFFKPDEVNLNINFITKGQTYEEVLRKGILNVQYFADEILLKNGFRLEDMKTRNFVIKEETKYDSVKHQRIFEGFSFNQSAALKFDYNKDRLANIMIEISKLDNAPTCKVDFKIKNEKECRRSILSKAYLDAQEQAMIIATAANKNLKQCVKVDFKPFTTDYYSKAQFGTNVFEAEKKCVGAAQAIVNTFTPEDIELVEVLYCLWIAE